MSVPSAKVTVTWDSSETDLVTAIEAHAAWIAGEVLAASLERVPGGTGVVVVGSELTVKVERT